MTNKTKEKILIVEDELSIAKALSLLFTKHGYEVSVAGDGAAGLAAAAESKPDVILLDIIMPKMDGMTMLGKLKENSDTQDIPVIILTNLSSQESVTKSFESGGTDYLIKVDYSLFEIWNLKLIICLLNQKY
jgi:DNA-binding response OmpR family regulator